jgi:hypothetical protein
MSDAGKSDRTRPYTPEEARVCDYLQRITNNQIGCGEDPIGFLISSHQVLSDERKTLLAAQDEADEACITAKRYLDQAMELTGQLKAQGEQMVDEIQKLMEKAVTASHPSIAEIHWWFNAFRERYGKKK